MAAATQATIWGRRKVVLVTGCAEGGIGYQYCLQFRSSGCEVYATDVRPLESMKSLEVVGIKTFRVDVTSESSVKCLVDTIMHEAGRIDILVNNAGIGMCGPLAEVPLKDVRKNFEVNVFGALSMIQHVLPYMIKAGGGKIVNIGSVAGYVATPWNGAYCATKASLHALTDTLRVELRPFNVDVVLITPGAVKSNLGKSNLQVIDGRKWSLYAAYDADIRERADAGGLGRATPAEELAEKVVKVVLQKRSPSHFAYGYMTGLFTLLWFLPISLKDFFMVTRFGLRKRPFFTTAKTHKEA
ncbi:hypothetical protein Mapa_017824 [Marchantia paleacea]|nr:hypothetical protein Mapa_017824 [Marchantia paleacea]